MGQANAKGAKRDIFINFILTSTWIVLSIVSFVTGSDEETKMFVISMLLLTLCSVRNSIMVTFGFEANNCNTTKTREERRKRVLDVANQRRAVIVQANPGFMTP